MTEIDIHCDVSEYSETDDSNSDSNDEDNQQNVIITPERMVLFTKKRSLGTIDIYYFINQSHDFTNYVPIPDSLLKKVFYMFSFFFVEFYKNVNSAELNIKQILATPYSISNVNDFLFRIRELYLKINNIDNMCFSLMYDMFRMNPEEETPCVLINCNFIDIIFEWCDAIYTVDNRYLCIKIIELTVSIHILINNRICDTQSFSKILNNLREKLKLPFSIETIENEKRKFQNTFLFPSNGKKQKTNM